MLWYETVCLYFTIMLCTSARPSKAIAHDHRSLGVTRLCGITPHQHQHRCIPYSRLARDSHTRVYSRNHFCLVDVRHDDIHHLGDHATATAQTLPLFCFTMKMAFFILTKRKPPELHMYRPRSRFTHKMMSVRSTATLVVVVMILFHSVVIDLGRSIRLVCESALIRFKAAPRLLNSD